MIFFPENEHTTFFHGYDIDVQRGPIRTQKHELRSDRENVILVCEGVCERPTRHTVFGRRLVTMKNGTPVLDEVVYECSSCQTHRVWGADELQEKSS